MSKKRKPKPTPLSPAEQLSLSRGQGVRIQARYVLDVAPSTADIEIPGPLTEDQLQAILQGQLDLGFATPFG